MRTESCDHVRRRAQAPIFRRHRPSKLASQANQEPVFSVASDSADRNIVIAVAQRELGAFIGAVTEMFGPEEARLSTDDWFDEFDSAENLSGIEAREWRRISIAAAVRLARRVLNRCETADRRLESLRTLTLPPFYCSTLAIAGNSSQRVDQVQPKEKRA